MLFTRLSSAFMGLLCLLYVSLYSQTTTFQQVYGGPGYDIVNDVFETADGYLIVGETSDPVSNHTDALLVHTDKNGVVLWKKTYGQFDADGFNSIISANDGGFLLWGNTKDFNQAQSSAWLVKLDEDGNLLWQKTLSRAGFARRRTAAFLLPAIPITLLAHLTLTGMRFG